MHKKYLAKKSESEAAWIAYQDSYKAPRFKASKQSHRCAEGTKTGT